MISRRPARGAAARRGMALTLLCLGFAQPRLRAQGVPDSPQSAARPGPAQVPAPVPAATSAAVPARPEEWPVSLQGERLFVIHAPLGPYSAADRAAAVNERLERLAADRWSGVAGIITVERDVATDLLAGDQIVATVTDADAAAAGRPRTLLARECAATLTRALREARERSGKQALLMSALYSLAATLGLLLFFGLLGWLFKRLDARIAAARGRNLPGVRLFGYELLPADRIIDTLQFALRTLRVALVLLALYFYLPLVLSFFPWTRALSVTLIGYAMAPVVRVGRAMVDYLPNVFYIAVICFATFYLLKFIHFLFREVERGAIRPTGFHADWAEPTYKLVRLLVLAFAVVVTFPYLPGSSSPAFQGVSVFLGVLISFGSSSAVANMVAGVVMTYMRPFKVGDRVRISETTGDVVERSLLVTRIRTIKNEDITIPNSMVLGSHIVNYSSSALDKGLILHTTVTIGYDAPWKRVHELLLAAARASDGILPEPPPFVLQTSLDDFYVSYQINAYTDQSNRMAAIYSVLHANIQDQFNAAGVEIMSPHYGSLRDGNPTTIPADHLPGDYEAPAFRVTTLDGGKPGGKP